MSSLFEDFRYALRGLRKSPGFTALAALTLALAIGPNSAIFSIVSAVLLRPLPIRDSERVVIVFETWKEKGLDQVPASAGTYRDWREQNTVFEQMGAAFVIPEYGFNVMAGNEPERVPGGKASATYLDVLGIKPVLGRWFNADEDRPGGPPVVVVSHAFWQRRLNSDPGAAGRTMAVDGIPRTITGVLPPEFALFGRVDVWVPVAIDPADTSRANRTYGILARLKPGVTKQQAQAQMQGIAQRMAQEHPETNAGWGATVIPIHELFSGRIAPAVLILQGAVGLLLLLACTNLASLLLARATSRRKEILIRAALGAGRWRIARQMLVESLLLSVPGGIIGILLAQWCITLLRGAVPEFLPLMKQMSVDGFVVAFTLAVTVLTSLVFGIVPAWKMARAEINEALKSGSRGTTSGDAQRMRSTLLAAEVALAVVLTAAAGLLARSFLKLTAVDPGLRTKNVLTMMISLPWARYPEEVQRATFFKTLTERLEALPGVNAAGGIHFLPFRGYFANTRISVWPYQVEGEPAAAPGQEANADYRVVTPGFFRAMNIRLHQGRYFSERDGRDAPRTVVINDALARRHFAGVNPIGRKVKVPPSDPAGREIVGVVADAKLYALNWQAEPAIYVPHAQASNDVMSLVVHSVQDPQTLAAVIRREVRSLDAEQPIADVRTMESVVADSLMLRRISMLFLGVFAVLSLTLAAVGTYGLTAYSVTQRTQEIGVRIALGAQRNQVFRMVIWKTLRLAAGGAVLGLLGAYGVSGLLKGLLFGVSHTDPWILLLAPLVLLTVAAIASYLPARQAMEVEPLIALRQE